MVADNQAAGRALRIEGIAGRWGDFELEPTDLHVPAGEYLVLLGPSGCGKTTLIELLCGLRKPAAGRIRLDDHDITHADPADRRIGYVPQDYQLFPMRTVEGNLRFAPTVKRLHGSAVQDRFRRVVDTLEIQPLLRRHVQTLSGGERQRVALGRALMADPDVLLLDEPVSALPESLRDNVCAEIKTIQSQLGITTIHVSHNLDEALSVATTLAVMDVGRIVQTAPPNQILDTPATPFVAQFTRARNVWPVDVRGRQAYAGDTSLIPTDVDDGPYWLVIRPEHIRVAPPPGPIEGRVAQHLRASHAHLVAVDLDDLSIWAVATDPLDAGQTVALHLPPDRAHLIPR